MYSPNADGLVTLVKDFRRLLAIVAGVTSFRIKDKMQGAIDTFFDDCRLVANDLSEGLSVPTPRIKLIADRGVNQKDALEAVFGAFLLGSAQHFNGLRSEIGAKSQRIFHRNRVEIGRRIDAYVAMANPDGFDMAQLASSHQELNLFLSSLRQQAHKEFKDEETRRRQEGNADRNRREGQSLLAILPG